MRTETFNWQSEDNSTCDLPDHPINAAVTVSIKENKYICGGGYPYTAQCFDILNGKEAPFNLLHERAYASSVTTKDTVLYLVEVMDQIIWPLVKPSALNMSRLRELCLLHGVMVAQL